MMFSGHAQDGVGAGAPVLYRARCDCSVFVEPHPHELRSLGLSVDVSQQRGNHGFHA